MKVLEAKKATEDFKSPVKPVAVVDTTSIVTATKPEPKKKYRCLINIASNGEIFKKGSIFGGPEEHIGSLESYLEEVKDA